MLDNLLYGFFLKLQQTRYAAPYSGSKRPFFIPPAAAVASSKLMETQQKKKLTLRPTL